MVGRAINFYCLVLVLLRLQGMFDPVSAVGKYKWDRPYVNRKTDCQIGPAKCCAPFLGHGGVNDPLDVPDGAYLSADTRYTDTDTSFDPEQGVTVEHYHPSDESTTFYFNMDREYKGHFYDQVHWQGNEIDVHGQKLAVCVSQKTVLPQGRTSYTLITYADIKLGRA